MSESDLEPKQVQSTDGSASHPYPPVVGRFRRNRRDASLGAPCAGYESATLQWLSNKWGLPDAARPAVRALLLAEARGSTAWELKEPLASWGRAASPSDQDSDSPIVLVQSGGQTFLQSRRHFLAERDIAAGLLSRLGSVAPAENLDGLLNGLFPKTTEEDLQVEAARVAAIRQLAIVTGGPGTGKTYVLARILALLVGGGLPASATRLAAPTGKAADRMKTAVTSSLEALPSDNSGNLETLTRVAASSSTIHSLLGYNPDTGRCRFGRDNPLPCRLLILDECSMIDVFLWQALLAALPAEARLVLLGDPNQLESVGQGNVFSELVREANSPESNLGGVHVHLTEAHRFKGRDDIVAFAAALEKSDGATTTKLLESCKDGGRSKGLAWLDVGDATLACERFPDPILESLSAVARAPSPEQALKALAGICVLTAQRQYFVGSKSMSAAIDRYFLLQAGTRNQPVIINRNDAETGLRNGTVGVIHTDADGKRFAWFRSGDGKLISFPVSKLPDFSPAWAITIHRSQGSEYDDVLVIVPREESPMATRELLYTAITRARSTVYVAGNLESVHKAAVTSSDRVTLLSTALRRGKGARTCCPQPHGNPADGDVRAPLSQPDGTLLL